MTRKIFLISLSVLIFSNIICYQLLPKDDKQSISPVPPKGTLPVQAYMTSFLKLDHRYQKMKVKTSLGKTALSKVWASAIDIHNSDQLSTVYIEKEDLPYIESLQQSEIYSLFPYYEPKKEIKEFYEYLF